MHITEGIQKVVSGRHLSRSEAESLMNEIMSGRATDAQIAAFLTALRMKCETVEELIGFARVMREKASRVSPRSMVDAAFSGTDREMLVDTCGTGGDATGTFNISTATAFVVAGAGIRVAKHGNRSVSSLCGSADVVEALGVRIDLPPEAVARCIDEAGIGFLYAPLLHEAMRYVVLARREMKIRTVFNLLGPICNPAQATAQVLGVYDEDLTEVMAQVLCELGTRRAFVVHGADGLDEITTSGESKISEVTGGGVRTYYVTPEDFGIDRAPISALREGRGAKRGDHPCPSFGPGGGAPGRGPAQRGRRAGGRGQGFQLAGGDRPGAGVDPVRPGARLPAKTRGTLSNPWLLGRLLLEADPAPGTYHDPVGAAAVCDRIGTGGGRVPPGMETERPRGERGHPDSVRESPERSGVRLPAFRIAPTVPLLGGVEPNRFIGHDRVHAPPHERGLERLGALPESPRLGDALESG